MSRSGRLHDHLTDLLWLAPGGFRDDEPGLLHDLGSERAREVIDAVHHLAMLYVDESCRAGSRDR